MADKNLIGGKYTVYLFLLQVFGQKNAIFLSFYKKKQQKICRNERIYVLLQPNQNKNIEYMKCMYTIWWWRSRD